MSDKYADPRPRGALKVVVAGGGVAALEATLALRALAEERVWIDLLSPDPRFWYRPLAVVEPFGMRSSKRVRFDSSCSRSPAASAGRFRSTSSRFSRPRSLHNALSSASS